jgi:hypothetical protein
MILRSPGKMALYFKLDRNIKSDRNVKNFLRLSE